MRNRANWAILADGLVILIFTAGFFHASPSREACSVLDSTSCERAKDREVAAQGFCGLKADPAVPPAHRGLMALTNAPGYRRAATLSLRVDDCTKAEDLLETKLQVIKGEIVEMLMEGTSGLGFAPCRWSSPPTSSAASSRTCARWARSSRSGSPRPS